MKSINMGRVFLGGLLAGVILNISEFLLHTVVLKKAFEEAMRSLNRPSEMTGGQTAVWIVFGFVMGIASIWLYAAIRPRYGPGAGTAARAGVAVWFFGSLLSAIAEANLGLFQGNVLVVSLIWELVQLIVATILGAWLYKEERVAYHRCHPDPLPAERERVRSRSGRGSRWIAPAGDRTTASR